MAPETNNNSRRLNQIIVFGFSWAFGILFASLEALRPSSVGFALQFSWWTLFTLLAGTAVMLPCFQIIAFSTHTRHRRAVLGFVALLGIAAFFYPLRFVPREKMGAVLTGLAAALVALSCVAGALVMLRRFFERDDKQSEQ